MKVYRQSTWACPDFPDQEEGILWPGFDWLTMPSDFGRGIWPLSGP
jgi:hypothetical protein